LRGFGSFMHQIGVASQTPQAVHSSEFSQRTENLEV